MGALASLAPWIPGDDLLLKNAVEARASLESLAIGAVQFSGKYSITEIKDRWYSLLYDPVISKEASAPMTTELSASPLPSKFYPFGHSKEQKVRGMPLIFEINQSRVKQYLNHISYNFQTF